MTDTEPSRDAASTSSTNTNVVIHRNLNIKPFVKQADSKDTAVRWERYKKDPGRRRCLHSFIHKFDNHFMPKKNKDFARFQLSEMKQQSREKLSDYYAKIRDIARKCDYGTHEDDAIRDHLIRTMLNNKIRSKAIRENWNLDRILTETALDEQTSGQAGAIKARSSIPSAAQKESRKLQLASRETRTKDHVCDVGVPRDIRDMKHALPWVLRVITVGNSTTTLVYVLENRNNKTTDAEKIVKEINVPETLTATIGTTKETRRNVITTAPAILRKDKEHALNTSRIKAAMTAQLAVTTNASYMHHLQTHHTSQDKGNGKTCTVQINGTDVLIEPDTGSDATIMDEQQLKILQEKAPEVKLKPSKVKLKALKEDLPVIGEADVIIENQTRTVYTTIVIIKGKIDSPALLGRETLEELGMVLIDTTGGLKSPNKSIKNVNQQKPDDNDIKLDEILNRYKYRFTGIGKAMRDGQEIKISVPMKDNAIPIAQKPRRVPYLLTEPLKKRIEEFVENDITEPVPEHEAITWCSPLVVQPKPKNPKDIRACLDLRLVNKSMLRTRQVQAPITEDFITEFKGCKIFSKLDLNHGYHQFALDEESRRIMTFSTPWGNYRYNRLAFGGLNSQDLFDAEMAKVISGIPRVLNNRDDVMIGGLDWNDHNTNLRILLQRIQDHNLTLRKEKYEFGKTTLNFHGHLFTADGLQPSPDKIKAVKECKRPGTKEELVSFLQMLAYLSRYINNFSSRCESLRRLTRDKAQFNWTTEQQAAFEDLKSAITSAPVLIPFYPERETLIICDGSPTGLLGGGLFQKTQHGYQPVHYVSRTLTETESRYSQIEREALSVEFTTSRLQMYLLGGKHFKIATDHKPLLPLFNNAQAKLPPRIERMVMKMQNLDFTMTHIPGKENATYYMSRHPLPETGKDRTDKHVKAVTQADHAIILDNVATATETDKELQHLKHAMRSGIWDKKDPVLKPYLDIQAEIYETENVILRLDKIIPPQELREKIIRIAHNQGHLGLSKTKEMIRHKYWWPEPAKMTELPARPWATIEVDFCIPFPNGEYALVARTTSFESTRKKLKKMFSTHGIAERPKQVEGFNKLVNKISAIARQDSIDPHEAIYDMLQAYRSTPHPATKTPPYQLLMNREVRTKLDHFPTKRHDNDKEVRENDLTYKQRCKEYHDKRHNVKTHTMKNGDAVVVKRENKRKGQTPYEPYIYIVIHTKGSQITAKRIKDERTICRDASKFKPLRTVKIQQEEPDIPTRPAVPNCIAEDKPQEEPTPAQMNATADTQQ
ncbi:hypothetical protein QZH41_014237, partial [Actinostola sp. cb2023]